MSADKDEVVEEITFDGQQEPEREYTETKPRNPPKEWLKRNMKRLGETGVAASRKAVEIGGNTVRRAQEIKQKYDEHQASHEEGEIERLDRKARLSQVRAQLASITNAGRAPPSQRRIQMAPRPRMQNRMNERAQPMMFMGGGQNNMLLGGRSGGSSLLSSGKSHSLLLGRQTGNSNLLGSGRKRGSMIPSFSMDLMNPRKRKPKRRR